MTEKTVPNVFSQLHTILAQEFLRRLSLGKCEHCGRLPASIQELEAARKFLSDNGITGSIAMPVENDVMEGLPTFDEDDPDIEVTREPRSE